MKINSKQWHTFNLCGEAGLFECCGSTTTPKSQLIKSGEGIYPYITTKATDNGTSGYYSVYTEPDNVITVDSAVLGTCFYQAKKFSASDHVELLIPKFKITKNIALFIVTVLNRMGKVLGYEFNDKRSQEVLKKELIPLPAKILSDYSYIPDWQYMEDFIKEIEKKVTYKLDFLSSFTTVHNISVRNWKR